MKINIIGDVMIDSFRRFVSYRSSPEAPVPILTQETNSSSLGGASNLARCLKKIGFNPSVYAFWPENRKDLLEQHFENIGISTDKIFFTKYVSETVKERILKNDEYICRIDKDMIINSDHYAFFDKFFEKNYEENINVISDYNKGVFNQFEKFSQNNKTKIHYVDPKRDDWNCYMNAKFIKANSVEIAQALRFSSLENKGSEIKKLLDLYKIENLIVTRGDKGGNLYNQNEEISYESLNVKPMDVSGAGDCFLAFFIWANHLSYDYESCLKMASTASAISVSKQDIYAPYLHEVIERLDGNLSLTQKQKINSKKVVLGGCFDVLHPGHIALLKHANELAGDVVVAINSDASVKRLKGESRPINCSTKRAENLRKTGLIQDVLIFDDNTPKEVLNTVKPDYFLKGGDYYGEESFEDFKFCRDNQIEIKIFKLVDGFSTTKIQEELVL
jgi:D-beta-D-heptose 7-phosphate kinase/D-beta-D-heptose 1-phosphate adenosyltransferase